MALDNSRLLVLDRGAPPRPRWSFGPVGQRLAGVFRGGSGAATEGRLQKPVLDDQLAPRFPVARRGYDCVAVDGYLADLERELAALDRELVELRGSGPSSREVANEITRIGEQTSAVLMAAHEQRQEILRRARADAEQCVADATAMASAVTAQCEEHLRDLKAQADSMQGERDRLLDDLRTISTALAAVADSADEREPRPPGSRCQEGGSGSVEKLEDSAATVT